MCILRRASARRRLGRRGYSLIDVAVGTLVMAAGILIFAGFYPAAARCSRMSGAYAQAVSEVQHKVDQLRAVGYGRLNYPELRAAGIIDVAPNASPYRFEQTDNLAALLWDPIGTIDVRSAGPSINEVRIQLTWRRVPESTQRSSHAVTILVAND